MKKSFLCLLMPAILGTALPVIAQDGPTSSYTFRHKDTPKMVERYYQTLFSASDHAIRTVRGDLLGHQLKDSICDIAVDPAGRMVAYVAVDKKGKKNAAVCSTINRDQEVFKYKGGKLGSPTAVGFSADARRFIVATDDSIRFFGIPKFKLQETIKGPGFEVNDLRVSPNGSLMIARGEKKVALYNLDDRTVRHTFDPGVEVTEAIFSPDSEYLALLTADGLLEVYFTNSLRLRTSVEDLGDALAADFNDNGKYVAVAISPNQIELINLVKPEDRRKIDNELGMTNDLSFLSDSFNNTLLGFTSFGAIKAERIRNLEPFFSKLVSDEADRKMNEWLKMMPGESMEEYAARVSDEARSRQRRLFEDETATSLAGDMLAMAEMTLGAYDRASQRLEVGFSNMPSVYLPVPEANIGAFHTGADLTVSDARYGVMPDDSFELVYAKFFNKNDGQTYLYDNQDRVAMSFMEGDDNIVSLEVLQQQQMEEMKLQELKEQIVDAAKHNNVISDHTNITVDSQVVPAYDASGRKILNYIVSVTYSVDPEFSAIEDFGPGKYKIEESGAAGAAVEIIKSAFEGELAQYITPGRRIKVKLSGSADATPIVHGIPYDGIFGDFVDEPVWQNGALSPLCVTKQSGIKTNEQLAFLRATALKDWLTKNIPSLEKTNTDYDIHVDVSSDKGSEFRRINADFTFIDVFGDKE